MKHLLQIIEESRFYSVFPVVIFGLGDTVLEYFGELDNQLYKELGRMEPNRNLR